MYTPKFTTERFVFEGTMGKASAELELLPKLASRMACMQSFISLEPSGASKRGVVVMECTYPFNLVTYDAVLHLIKGRHFKFKVSGSSGLEMAVTFAPTITALDMIIPGGVANRTAGRPTGDETDSAQLRVINYMPGARPPPGALVPPRALWDDAVTRVDPADWHTVFPARYILHPTTCSAAPTTCSHVSPPGLTSAGSACSQSPSREPTGPALPGGTACALPPGLGCSTPPAAAPARPPPRGLPGVRRALFSDSDVGDGDMGMVVVHATTHGWAGRVEEGDGDGQRTRGRGGRDGGDRGDGGFSGRSRRILATDPQRRLAVRRGCAQGGDTARPTPPMGEG